MTSKILRFEKTKSRTGEDEIFLQVEINDGDEIYRRAEWLNKEQVKYVLADETTINTIAEQIAERGTLDRPQAKIRSERAKEMITETIKLKNKDK